MTDDDIETIIDAFGESARRVQEAGFDGVQIHGAHGYLITQFLSPSVNRRRDRWGGSLENRMRFVIEVARAVRRQVDELHQRPAADPGRVAARPGDDERHRRGRPSGARPAQARRDHDTVFVEPQFQ